MSLRPKTIGRAAVLGAALGVPAGLLTTLDPELERAWSEGVVIGLVGGAFWGAVLFNVSNWFWGPAQP